MDNIRKTYAAQFDDLNLENREVVAIISTDNVDRDHEVVLPSGLQRRQFQNTPIVMYNHDYKSLPIGRAKWIKADKNRIIAKYRITEATDFANDVWKLICDGVLTDHSIGFTRIEAGPPTKEEIKARPDWADAKTIHRKFDLYEFSLTGVPSNPDCVTIQVAKSLSPTTREFLGEAFEPAEEMFVWEELLEEAVAKAIEPPAVEPPPPNYEREIQILSAARLAIEELRNELRGVNPITAADILRIAKGRA